MAKQMDGIKQLATVLDIRAKATIKGDDCSNVAIELGTVKENGIKADSFSKVLEDFLVVKGVDFTVGDRVLIAWLDSDLCIMGVIDEK